MTALDEFYEAYLHYSVSQRLFEDRCRQLTECTGTVAERQALVDETLRLAMCVTNNVIDLEPLLSEAADELRNDGGDRDILKALSLISNSVREDRDRADSYTLFVTARRSGNTVRRPRKPRVANPFVYVEEESEDEEEEVVAPAPAHEPAREKPKPVVPVEEPEDPVGDEVEETEDEIAEEPEEEPTSDVVPEPNEDPVEKEKEPAPVVGPVPPAPDDRPVDEDPVEDESKEPEDPTEDEEISDKPEDPSEDNESRSFLESVKGFFSRILKR